MKCECLKVQPVGNGTWQCIMGDCRRKFVPAEKIDLEPYHMGRQDEREHLRLEVERIFKQYKE